VLCATTAPASTTRAATKASEPHNQIRLRFRAAT
jgi:hypothetical protein